MSPTSYTSVPNGSRKERCLSASQIAKDAGTFEIWSARQGCEEVDLTEDFPAELEVHVDEVFNLVGRLPFAWVDEANTIQGSKAHRRLIRAVGPAFLDFLRAAYDSNPDLFSSLVRHDDVSRSMLGALQAVSITWSSAQRMRQSSRKWSEADYATSVYIPLRAAGVLCSDLRAQCSIPLPQPLAKQVTAQEVRILNAQTAKPDGSLWLPTRLLVDLCRKEDSPFKILSRSSKKPDNVLSAAGGESSFRYQSTLCKKLPDERVFEIASAFWEDKKPSQDELDVAYRQNRMATTSALRQLHALNVRAPVFGVVWAEGCVRAHVDWWKLHNGDLRIYSAAYSGPPPQDARRTSTAFHQWNLANPSDIIQVYLLISNLDRWTTGRFRQSVISGVTALAGEVQAGKTSVTPWRRKGDVGRLVKKAGPDTVGESVSSTEPAKRVKTKRRRKARRSSSISQTHA
ncbi:hypothetical protein OH77DRAFT_1391015 [Trametes cingulata]|nr:hypothetical protein OH77DRAFT_1391015 [Trametes cingulata]